MLEYVNECMTIKNQLTALGEIVPEKPFIVKLLSIYRELSYLRPTLARASVEDIISGLTDGYSFHDLSYRHQQQHGYGGRGRFQRRRLRGQGASAAAGAPAMAAVNTCAGQRLCYNCGSQATCAKTTPRCLLWLDSS